MEVTDLQSSAAEQWVARAVGMGAAGARVVPAASVVTAQWVRLKCQYGCGGFGRRLTCPPHSPTPDQTRRVLDEYRYGLLVHSPGDQKWTSVKQLVADLEREIFLAGHYKAFGFGSGPCNLCETCPLEYCLQPDRARPAMEACGIDVYATVRANGFPISVVTDYQCPQDYYGLVMIE